jgi:hypothetical protein
MDEKEISIITAPTDNLKECPKVHLYMYLNKKMCNDCFVDFFIRFHRRKKRTFLHRFYIVDALGLGRHDDAKLHKFIKWTKDIMTDYTRKIIEKHKINISKNGWENINKTYYQLIENICEENR